MSSSEPTTSSTASGAPSSEVSPPPIIDLSVDVESSHDTTATATALWGLIAPLGHPARVWWVRSTGLGGDGYVAAQILTGPSAHPPEAEALWEQACALPGAYRGEMATVQRLCVPESFDPAFDPDHPDMHVDGVYHQAANGVPGRAWWWPGTPGELPEAAPAPASRKVAGSLGLQGPLAAGLCAPSVARHATGVVQVWTPHLLAAYAETAEMPEVPMGETPPRGDTALPLAQLGAYAPVLATARQMVEDLWRTARGAGRPPFAADTDPTIATHNLGALANAMTDLADAALLRWLLTAQVELP